MITTSIRHPNVHPALRIPAQSDAEIKALLTWAKENPRGTKLEDIVRLILGTGMRAGELRDLRWADVNLEHHFARLISGRNRTTRCIPFGPGVCRVLEHMQGNQVNSKYVLGASPSASLKWASQQLQLFSAGSFGRPVSLYKLRQEFAIRWVASGGSMESLSYVMGRPLSIATSHSRPSTESLFQEAMKHVAERWTSDEPRERRTG